MIFADWMQPPEDKLGEMTFVCDGFWVYLVTGMDRGTTCFYFLTAVARSQIADNNPNE